MRLLTILGLTILTTAVAACRGGPPPGDASGLTVEGSSSAERELNDPNRSTIWDIFGPNTNEQVTQVNRYLWSASLDVLNFLPVQEVDPFTGVIVTGYGTPPGGGRSYRATVHISDPALAARGPRYARPRARLGEHALASGRSRRTNDSAAPAADGQLSES